MPPSALMLGGRRVPLVLIRSPRARRALLRVDCVAGEIRLTLPARAPLKQGYRLVEGHQNWLEAQVARMPYPRPFIPGAVIPYRGCDLVLQHKSDAGRKPVLSEDRQTLCVGGPLEGLARRVELWLKAQALDLLREESRYFAAQVDRTVASVRIADPRGRWGSCTGKGSIAYNWRLIFMPDRVRRSIVAHEVAHLVHLNHSPAFHALLGRLSEDNPDASRQWLAQHGPGLHWIGRAA